jgi:hypothetical protein
MAATGGGTELVNHLSAFFTLGLPAAVTGYAPGCDPNTGSGVFYSAWRRRRRRASRTRSSPRRIRPDPTVTVTTSFRPVPAKGSTSASRVIRSFWSSGPSWVTVSFGPMTCFDWRHDLDSGGGSVRAGGSSDPGAVVGVSVIGRVIEVVVLPGHEVLMEGDSPVVVCSRAERCWWPRTPVLWSCSRAVRSSASSGASSWSSSLGGGSMSSVGHHYRVLVHRLMLVGVRHKPRSPSLPLETPSTGPWSVSAPTLAA